MLYQNVVTDAIEYARQLFGSDPGGHDFYHTLRVYKMASRIAKQEGARLDIVQLAALLHDADDHKISPETHETLGNAVSFLQSHGVTDADISAICSAIRTVSYTETGDTPPASLESACVRDADRLDATGAIGIARAFAFGGMNGRPIYDPDIPCVDRSDPDALKNAAHTSTSFNHFGEKMLHLEGIMCTETAKSIARGRTLFLQEFASRFLSEWDGDM